MKSGRYFFILFLILLIMPAYAQKGVDITGTVIEEGPMNRSNRLQFVC